MLGAAFESLERSDETVGVPLHIFKTFYEMTRIDLPGLGVAVNSFAVAELVGFGCQAVNFPRDFLFIETLKDFHGNSQLRTDVWQSGDHDITIFGFDDNDGFRAVFRDSHLLPKGHSLKFWQFINNFAVVTRKSRNKRETLSVEALFKRYANSCACFHPFKTIVYFKAKVKFLSSHSMLISLIYLKSLFLNTKYKFLINN